jgi:uncharacterized membrane protein
MTQRSVSAGNGWNWIADGFNLFLKNPVMWVVLTVLLVVGTMLIAIIPFLGGIAITLLWPVLIAGLLIGCRALDGGQPLELPHLWAGFQTGDRLSQLVIVGVVYLVATVVVMGIAFAAIGVPVMQAIRAGAAPNATLFLSMMGTFLIGLLVALALLVPVIMAMWFAPALIVFDNLEAVDAMKQSFAACLRNIVPFLIYGVIAFVLNIVAAIPFGLGYLVLVPVLVCSLYAGYKDIFAGAAPVIPAAPVDNPLLR